MATTKLPARLRKLLFDPNSTIDYWEDDNGRWVRYHFMGDYFTWGDANGEVAGSDMSELVVAWLAEEAY